MGMLPLAVLAILIVHCTSLDFVPPAGKCRDNITALGFDAELGLTVPNWNAIYHPDGKDFSNLDSDHEDILFIYPTYETDGIHRMKLMDNTIVEYRYRYFLGPNNVILERVIDKGETLVFWLYIIGFIPDVNAFLYYRCLKTGSVVDYDTRFISLPVGQSLSAAGERQLVDKDASFHFIGGIRKLDNKLSW